MSGRTRKISGAGPDGEPKPPLPPDDLFATLPYPSLADSQVDTDQLRFGAEYVLIRGRLKWPFRAGLFTDQQYFEVDGKGTTGIGTDNVEIVMAEILAITERPTLVRVGSCGALQPEMGLGDLVISTGAVRLETTTRWFVDDGYPAVASYEVVLALLEASAALGHPTHLGLTATAPGFFGAQGRPIPQLPIRFPDLAEQMMRQGVLNFEMEASALLVLAGLAGCRAGVVCSVYAQRSEGRFVTGPEQDAAESACVETGLESLVILAEMDRQKRQAGVDRWRPSLWTRSTADTGRGIS